MEDDAPKIEPGRGRLVYDKARRTIVSQPNGYETAYQELKKAGDALSFAAQTSGGIAGRDDSLVAAIEGWQQACDKARALRRIQRFEGDGTAVSAGSLSNGDRK